MRSGRGWVVFRVVVGVGGGCEWYKMVGKRLGKGERGQGRAGQGTGSWDFFMYLLDIIRDIHR